MIIPGENAGRKINRPNYTILFQPVGRPYIHPNLLPNPGKDINLLKVWIKKEGSPETGSINWILIEILIARLTYKHPQILEKVLSLNGTKL